jgi:hypothetical protein
MGGALALAACSSTPDWMNIDALKPAPVMDTVRFESTPPGAEAKTSNGQTCRTPCALALPTTGTLTVSFSLNGYLPDSESLDLISADNGRAQLQPNPVVVELSPAPPPPKPVKPVKKPAAPAKKKTSAVTPAMAAKPATTSGAPAQQAASPWPAAPAQPKQ